MNQYNWGQRGHGLYGEPPEGDQVTAWWTAQWTSCGASTANIILEIRNFRHYGLRSPGWQIMGGDWDDWCITSDPNTTSNFGSCTFVTGGVRMPTGQRALHGAGSRVGDQNVSCVVVVYDMKSNGVIMANAGADHIAGGSILGDMFISKYKRVDGTWDSIGGSSCTANTLRAMPPPGF